MYKMEIKKKNATVFFIYFMRWQLSTLIMSPFMMLFEHLGFSTIPNLVITQCIGALIFFNIDRFIFKSEKQENPENSENQEN